MQPIQLAFGNTTIHAELDGSATARAFAALLPATLTMTRYDDREYYAALPEPLPAGGEEIPDYSNGDVTFFPELGTLAVFYDRAGASSQPGLVKMGRITAGLDAFKTLPETAACVISAL